MDDQGARPRALDRDVGERGPLGDPGGDATGVHPCERLPPWPSTLRAIALGLQALRKVERYGITTDHQQYRGWRAIESTVVPGDLSLDQAKIAIQRYAQADGSLWDREPEVIRLAVRRAKSHSHPDHPRGRGSAEAFHQVSLAETRLRAEGVIA